DFLLGAGAVIIQPSTHRVCILEEAGRFFLPRGRKDVGESLEQAALREAYEEDAVPDEDTRMPDEQNYVTHLIPYADALAAMESRGDPLETAVLKRGIGIWLETTELLSKARAAA
ncbi:hypothetical protein AURDEDRAFT_57543, partial [Auricularia subglabra TFB-10046 SS5]